MESDTLGSARRITDAARQYCIDSTRGNIGGKLFGLIADTTCGAEKHIMLSPRVVLTSKVAVQETAGQRNHACS